MNSEKNYVRTDEHGVMRVGSTRVMLDGIIAAFAQGHSPETIAQQYPALSLEEVYGAITFILANPQLVAEYVARQDATWEAARQQAAGCSAPVVQRLRTLARQRETHVQ